MSPRESPTPARTVQYWKWGEKLHWRHDMVHLGRDDHGTWLGAPAGTVVQRGHEPPVELPTAFVQLVRPDVLWTAIFNAPGSKYEVYVDITTAAHWVSDTRVEFVDMDLDVVRWPTGEAAIIDQDEFEEHTELFGYPADLVGKVAAAANDVLQQVESRTEPFGRHAQRWLAMVT